MKRVHANPADVWKPGTFPMNHAVVEPAGRRVHLTGQVAWDADGNVVGTGDPEHQTNVALENIARILRDLGGEMSDIVSLTTYFVRHEDRDAINRARSRVFRKETGPVATAVRVAGLWDPDLLVELTAIAVIPEDRIHTSE